ncbi:amino acid adenylation domain-containing protein [Sphaerisporangium sp. TRM90804]|uniref:non-ribosomal peptide synthetase n=1 Tax=Sphaerisporangium sp. TRM90804 TaxID=3031113 RepID=UPI0024476E2C|nr:amino acid adenylation domain-containing protein [Sphaerisporangium sp. TRM90804]MDH2424456.1 amino acid adenylation domain-containing protein [Sphaerisporangium sp. TRM90804]
MIPLSSAQRRMWFLDKLEPGEVYTIPTVLRLSGVLDVAALRAALCDVVARHEVLRTVYPQDTRGVPFQRIIPAARARPEVESREVVPAALDAALAEYTARGFDLAADLPLRAGLFTLSRTEHVLVLLLHHIAADGWSMAPLARDLSTAYGARREGTAPGWLPLPVQYADYALWEREMLGDPGDPGSVHGLAVAYWAKRLAGVPERLELPTGRTRPASATARGGAVHFRLDAPLHRALLALAGENRASLFMVLHAALAALLSRLGAGTDIPIGTPVAGRTDEALDDLVGLFVNTLVVRADTGGDPSFRELLGRTRATALDAMAHQELPFEHLVEALNPERSAVRNPLFQVMLVVQNHAAARFDLPGLTVRREPDRTSTAKFDLTLSVTAPPEPDGRAAALDAELEYSLDLFDAEGAARIADRFVRLLTAVAADPDLPLGELEIMSAAERRRAATGGNDAGPPPPAASLPELFRAQVERTPDAVAVSGGGAELTYARLDARANQLAHRLLRLGITPETPVAVLMERSADLVVASLAVLKAGGCYVPLHPGNPPGQLAWVTADAGAPVLLTDRAFAARPFPHAAEVVVVDADPSLAREPAGDPRVRVLPGQLAYVMYTSGSTGRPKGVGVEQRAVAAFAADRRWRGGAHRRVLMHSPYAFDASTYEMWVPLLAGGRVVVAPPGDLTPHVLGGLLAERRVTGMFLTAGLFRVVAEELPACFSGLREVWTGGDVVPPGAVARVLEACPGTTVVDGYGPTETTTFATSHAVRTVAELEESVPIGGPIDAMRAYVLDERLRPVPDGVAGELYLAGAQLARGYAGRPGLTAERFVAAPFGAPGERMYRTGDRARRHADGTLRFLGRVDDQVKIRGFRVELGEIENALTRRPDVGQAVAAVHEHRPGDHRLAAYVVPAAAAGPDPGDLRAYLRRHLPEHMVPATIVSLPALPLTGNGKVDRRRLPRPVPAVAAGASRRPGTPAEAAMARIFADVLGVPEVGVEDDFFRLGGHSLLAATLITRVRAATGAPLGIRDLFDAPTAALLARRLGSGAGGGDPLAALLPLRAEGDRAPLFCVHPAAGIGWVYSGLLRHLDPGTPLYALQSRGLTDPAALRWGIADIAADCVRLIQSVQPSGPYHLLGWSFGGGVAHEVAVLLQSAGERVDLLVVLDGYPAVEAAGRDRAVSPRDPRVLSRLAGSLGIDDVGEEPSLEVFTATVRRPGSPLENLPPEAVTALTEVFARNWQIAGSVTGAAYRGDLVVFAAMKERPPDVPDPGVWRPHVDGNVVVHETPSTHGAMMRPDALAHIGPEVARLLTALREERPLSPPRADRTPAAGPCAGPPGEAARPATSRGPRQAPAAAPTTH